MTFTESKLQVGVPPHKDMRVEIDDIFKELVTFVKEKIEVEVDDGIEMELFAVANNILHGLIYAPDHTFDMMDGFGIEPPSELKMRFHCRNLWDQDATLTLEFPQTRGILAIFGIETNVPDSGRQLHLLFFKGR